jgi:hypothetical protein
MATHSQLLVDELDMDYEDFLDIDSLDLAHDRHERQAAATAQPAEEADARSRMLAGASRFAPLAGPSRAGPFPPTRLGAEMARRALSLGSAEYTSEGPSRIRDRIAGSSRRVPKRRRIKEEDDDEASTTAEAGDANEEIIHLPGEIDSEPLAGPSRRAPSPTLSELLRPSPHTIPDTLIDLTADPPPRPPTPPPVPSRAQPLAEYACPICFCPPTRATLMPCGHVCCGECLFTAVKTTQRRNTYVVDPRTNTAK